MGRYVYERDTCVWKYVFAGQSSEQYLIPELIGVGSMVYNKRQTHDYLLIYCSENSVRKLRHWVRCNHPEVPDMYDADKWPEDEKLYFPCMVWAYANHIEDQLPTRKGERLRFWGEY
tara:strand:- start:2789 stop:3139 length:351 start_codon:yes stop_codon:yes gene_type:complete